MIILKIFKDNMLKMNSKIICTKINNVTATHRNISNIVMSIIYKYYIYMYIYSDYGPINNCFPLC